MREREIEKKLVEGIKSIGGVAYKFVSPGNDGVPDRIVALPGGRIAFVELKTETGRLSSRQNIQIKRLTQMGFDVQVPKGPAEVEDFLKRVKKEVEWYEVLAARISKKGDAVHPCP